VTTRLIIGALAWLAFWPAAAGAAEITVRADRDPVAAHESFQIEFEARGGVDGDPDFSPLNRDFNVLSTAQSTSFSFVNGKTSSSKTWTLTVLPRRTGRLIIPPVAFGKDRSPSASVTVTETASAGASRDSGDVFIEVEARPLRALVQSQVNYTARLFIAVPVSDATLSEPKLESGDAVIERLGEDGNYETQVMGRRFKVLERNYAIFPQGSGRIVLAPLEFQGRIGRDVFSLFDPFGPQPKAVVRRSAPVTLDVQPIPDGYSAPHWLPAKDVQVTEKWSPDPPEFRVGDPVTRTLVISADGLSASQLPELGAPYPDGIRVYPDQPALDNRSTPSGVIGSRQEKAAIIPTAPGEYVLPAISVPWWDTQSGTPQEARLPERRILVLPATGAAAPGPAASRSAEPAPPVPAPPPGPDAESEQALPAAADAQTWIRISAFLAAGWLLTVLFWWRQQRGGRSADRRERIESARRAAHAVSASCRVNDPKRTRDALLRWAAIHWPAVPPRSVGELALRCEGDLAAELQRLNGALYAREPGGWNGAGLRREFERATPRAEKRLAADDSALEPLFRL
jgi:hypothetical protein